MTRPTRNEILVTRLQHELTEQEAWVKKCGGNLLGYIQNYGSKDEPDHSGDGGEAIYAADMNHLNALREQLATASLKAPKPLKNLAVSVALRELKSLAHPDTDPESGHGTADGILTDLIEVLLDGDDSVTKAFDNVEKWYA